jgi:hypothetical protein
MIERSYAVPKAVISLCWLGCAGALASACSDGGGGSRPSDAESADAETDDAETATEAGGADASPEDAEAVQDADPSAALDGSSTDAGADDASLEDGDLPEAGCDAGGGACPASDPLAPFQLDCANLPAGAACQGGPHEALLVTARTGHILMFDATDGDFLGYFKREAADYNTRGISGYSFATQGPDQCIWSVSEANDAAVQRWNPDGTFKDAPLAPTFVPVSGRPDEAAIRNPWALAFSRDRVFVASHYGTPNPRVTRWQLDGKYDGIALEDELEIRSLLVLGDGSLLVADDDLRRVVRVPVGGLATPVLGGLTRPGQLSYTAAGKALVADDSSGEPVYEVEIETGMARTVYPHMGPDGLKGVAPLKNGKWLVAGGEYEVSVLDPASSNPTGQHRVVWTDKAAAPGDFIQIGRACLSEAFLASRASKPANDVCIDPPAGAVLFEENFETGAFEGSGTSRHFNAFYDLGVAGVTTSIDATGGVGGSRALMITGAGEIDTGDPAFPQEHKTGMFASFTGGRAKYVSYRVKVASADHILGYLLLENAATSSPEQFDWLAGMSFDGGILSVLASNLETAGELVDQWVRIELRNIDWSARTFDLYVNCTRLGEAVGMPAGLGDAIDRIDVYNYPYMTDANSIAWYDDILIK